MIYFHKGIVLDVGQSVSLDASKFLKSESYSNCKDEILHQAERNNWKVAGNKGDRNSSFQNADETETAFMKSFSTD